MATYPLRDTSLQSALYGISSEVIRSLVLAISEKHPGLTKSEPRDVLEVLSGHRSAGGGLSKGIIARGCRNRTANLRSEIPCRLEF